MTTGKDGDGGLAGRVAVVTGGSAGIGAATVRALVGDGAAVGFSARNAEAVAALESELSATGATVVGVAADMSVAEEIDSFLGRVGAELGPVDILVNNAGAGGAPEFEHFRPTTAGGELFDLNLIGAVHATRAVLGGMRERGWGRVVMVSSVAAKAPGTPPIDYSASKVAMVAVAKGLARHCGRDGILIKPRSCPAWSADLRCGGGLSPESPGRPVPPSMRSARTSPRESR